MNKSKKGHITMQKYEKNPLIDCTLTGAITGILGFRGHDTYF